MKKSKTNNNKTSLGGELMNNNQTVASISNTTKEANSMENNFVNVPMIVKSVSFGITTADITKFFGLNSDEIAPSLDAHYTKHKVYAKRTLTQLRANDNRAAENSQNRKRVSFSDDLVNAALFLIYQGATMADLSRCFNIKDRQTIKRWLLTKWPNVGKKHYSRLMENEKFSKKLLIPSVHKVADIEETFESWYGGSPDVDCIISRYLPFELMELAKDYCEQQGLSYIISKAGTYITAQSAALGRPTIISDSLELKPLCEEDAIPFIMATDLYDNVVHFEMADIQFASKINFKSFIKSKSGVYSCKTADLTAEYLKKFGFSNNASCKVFLSNTVKPYKEAPERLGIKPGQSIIILVTDENEVFASKYQLSAGNFLEVSYAFGPCYMVNYIMKKLA